MPKLGCSPVSGQSWALKPGQLPGTLDPSSSLNGLKGADNIHGKCPEAIYESD